MKIVQRHYHAFQSLAFGNRESWQWYTWPLWLYLIVFVWLHQGIVHKNWQNVFEGIGNEIQDQYKKYRQRRRMKRILRENSDIAELSKLSGIKNERKD